MKVTVTPIVIRALGMISKGLVRGLEELEILGQMETIQITSLLRLARILRRVSEAWGDSSKRLSVNAGIKNSQEIMIMIIIGQPLSKCAKSDWD